MTTDGQPLPASGGCQSDTVAMLLLMFRLDMRTLQGFTHQLEKSIVLTLLCSLSDNITLVSCDLSYTLWEGNMRQNTQKSRYPFSFLRGFKTSVITPYHDASLEILLRGFCFSFFQGYSSFQVFLSLFLNCEGRCIC